MNKFIILLDNEFMDYYHYGIITFKYKMSRWILWIFWKYNVPIVYMICMLFANLWHKMQKNKQNSTLIAINQQTTKN